jgi:hypothetical protein
MTEDISQVYENVDIKAWAQQIRENKIRELTDAVEAKQKEGLEFTEIEIGGFRLKEAIEHLEKCFNIAFDIIRMELKLEQLKKA